MDYKDTVNYLFSRLPMYQRDGKSAYKKNLSNIYTLLEKLDDPHKKFKSVHIAGTNGKGTCAHATAAILQLAGYKTGLYTSPHLKSFTERIKINGRKINESFVVDFVSEVKDTIEKTDPSFFEITVAMAFEYFARQKVDIAVIETGLGGRLDSTNVIIPEACLITNIGLDHMDMLGDTLEKIATEKAGIIKKGIPVVVGEYNEKAFPVFVNKAKAMRSRLIFDHDFGQKASFPPLSYHKTKNSNSIFTLIKLLKELGLKIEDTHLNKGYLELEKLTGLMGRSQVLSKKPYTIVDIAHNELGLDALFSSIKSKLQNGRLHLIFGTVKDKDLKPIFKLFPKNSEYYWTEASVPRSLEVEKLSRLTKEQGLIGESYKNVNDALNAARKRARPEDTIVVTGSTFVVAELDEL
ncbi:MAG: bifunctional folylpolyglutamate synthase/dihydrofolate synthase [Ekhidna sp.]|nr:bifunctional folylpolyglutamate synthase/dihydrofolate synthase [Ekhidna sp.]